MSQSATKRSFDILELLAASPQGLGLTEIVEALRIPKSVAHRLLAQLAELGFVRQDAASARYGLTLKLTLLGLRHYAGTGLSDLAQPVLDRLASQTGELARLAIVEGQGMVWVAKAQGARYGLRYDPDTGQQVVLHATATGKAWLATLPESDALGIVAATGFATPSRFGPNVIRDLDTLRSALRKTRGQGYGLATEEGEPGTAAVAVAVRGSADPHAAAVATLSVAGPVTRFTPGRQQEFAAILTAAAAELSAIWPVRNSLGNGMARDPQSSGSPAGDEVEHVL